MKTVRLRPGKERSLQRRHPWVFEGSVAGGKADAGETVRVEDSGGRFLAWAAYSPQSLIRLRAWSFDEPERIDAAFLARRIADAIAVRSRLPIESDGVRLVHGESDGLPGLVVDRYGDTLSAQFLSAGAERWRDVIADALLKASGAAQLYERSDTSARQREGLAPSTGWLRAPAGDAAPPTVLTVREHGWRLGLDVASGHKTGFYLDQRDNRRLFADTVRHFGFRRVLNCYCYTGGFSVAGLAGGAEEVTGVDSSAPALERAVANVALNGFDAARHRTLDADVNQTLRAMLAQGERFDAIVLDPPKLAPTAAHAERAARAYKDINRLALMRCGRAARSSPSRARRHLRRPVPQDRRRGRARCRRRRPLLRPPGAAPDHPMTVTFPEGEYLKGLCRLKR
jgi:23S rRNA (cytosine1962-C5)-methyltransferase